MALIEAGANVHAETDRGYQALHFAVNFGAPVQYIEYLLKLGLDINHRSKDGGGTPLVSAVSRNAPVIRYLLENGADPEIGSYQDESLTPLIRAIKFNKHESLRILFDWGLGYAEVSEKGDTVLHVAAEWGDEETFEILRNGGLEDVDVEGRNRAGLTARMVLEKRAILGEELGEAFDRLLESVRVGGNEVVEYSEG